jgi:hypothetical protein
MNRSRIRERYLSNSGHFANLEIKEGRLLLFLSVLRLVTFTGGIILIWIGFTINNLAGLALTLVLTILFLYLLKLFSEHSQKREFFSNLSLINQKEADALSGNLSGFEEGLSYMDISHDFSADVDLFGAHSLFQYLNRTVTGYGRDILASWLSDPYALSSELIPRQEAIRELASKDNWRQEFMASGMKAPFGRGEISGLLEWFDRTNSGKSILKTIIIFLLPSVAVISFLLMIAGIVPYSVFSLIFLINLLYIAIGIRKTNAIHNVLSRKYNILSSMKGLLNMFENESFTSHYLNEIKLNVSGKGSSASSSVRKLGRLIQAFDSRMNMIAGFFLNGLLLWDYHCIYRLEKWKSEYKNLFPFWLEMVGEVDAYISLGNYAFNNPGFTYPVISENNTVFSVKSLGHQLIEENKRVCNDFTLEKKGTVCIISGANMAGKSTFLRTVAVNYILAMAGAPVCARELSFIPMKLFTSMRTTDSLSDNESYFYAELKRLKALKSGIENKVPFFFILDEILKGTNSDDKSTGSKLFLQRLVQAGGTGLLATHDISIGKLESEYPGIITNKCFEIEIDGESIKFDYKIQEGITRKMNAVFLMKQMGIID